MQASCKESASFLSGILMIDAFLLQVLFGRFGKVHMAVIRKIHIVPVARLCLTDLIEAVGEHFRTGLCDCVAGGCGNSKRIRSLPQRIRLLGILK